MSLLKLFGDAWFVLTSKLKKVKVVLRRLSSSAGNIHSDVADARNALLDFQLALTGIPTTQQFEEKAKLEKILQDSLKAEEIFLKQKSRVHWLKCGDGNNRYLFNSCKGRWNLNKILSLEDASGVMCSSHSDIARVTVNYFQDLMGHQQTVHEFPDNIDLPQLTASQQSFLDAPFAEQDIIATLKGMAKNNCPGPDGFPAEFYIATWSVIGADVTKEIIHFFNSLHLSHIINSSAIALVPKSQPATSMTDYKPISCCSVLY